MCKKSRARNPKSKQIFYSILAVGTLYPRGTIAPPIRTFFSLKLETPRSSRYTVYLRHATAFVLVIGGCKCYFGLFFAVYCGMISCGPYTPRVPCTLRRRELHHPCRCAYCRGLQIHCGWFGGVNFAFSADLASTAGFALFSRCGWHSQLRRGGC